MAESGPEVDEGRKLLMTLKLAMEVGRDWVSAWTRNLLHEPPVYASEWAIRCSLRHRGAEQFWRWLNERRRQRDWHGPEPSLRHRSGKQPGGLRGECKGAKRLDVNIDVESGANRNSNDLLSTSSLSRYCLRRVVWWEWIGWLPAFALRIAGGDRTITIIPRTSPGCGVAGA